MKMVAHQAVGMDLPGRFLARLRQSRQEPFPVLIVLEDSFTPITTIHHDSSHDKPPLDTECALGGPRNVFNLEA
jgi:hypothetical protein